MLTGEGTSFTFSVNEIAIWQFIFINEEHTQYKSQLRFFSSPKGLGGITSNLASYKVPWHCLSKRRKKKKSFWGGHRPETEAIWKDLAQMEEQNHFPEVRWLPDDHGIMWANGWKSANCAYTKEAGEWLRKPVWKEKRWKKLQINQKQDKQYLSLPVYLLSLDLRGQNFYLCIYSSSIKTN